MWQSGSANNFWINSIKKKFKNWLVPLCQQNELDKSMVFNLTFYHKNSSFLKCLHEPCILKEKKNRKLQVLQSNLSNVLIVCWSKKMIVKGVRTYPKYIKNIVWIYSYLISMISKCWEQYLSFIERTYEMIEGYTKGTVKFSIKLRVWSWVVELQIN